MSTIYVETTTKSTDFRNICSDPYRAKHIKRVIYMTFLQQLRDEEVRYELEHQRHEKVESHIVDQVCSIYAERREEQRALLQEQQMAQLFVDTFPLLPSLEVVCLSDSPLFHSYWRSPSSYDGAYNVPKSWREHLIRAPRSPPKGDSEYAKTLLGTWWFTFYDDRCRPEMGHEADNISLLFDVVGADGGLRPLLQGLGAIDGPDKNIKLSLNMRSSDAMSTTHGLNGQARTRKSSATGRAM
jgi:hypothetical protein